VPEAALGARQCGLRDWPLAGTVLNCRRPSCFYVCPGTRNALRGRAECKGQILGVGDAGKRETRKADSGEPR
jgi:hypothetical protein